MFQNKSALLYCMYSWFVYSSKNMFRWVEHEVQCGRNTQNGSAQGRRTTFCDCFFTSRCDGINRFYRCSRDSSTLLPRPCCACSHTLSSSLSAVLATLWAGAHPASHRRVLPNTRRTTFINVTGLLPAVHFFLWVPQVHFSCSSSNAGYLVWPVPPQQYIPRISFKVLQC